MLGDRAHPRAACRARAVVSPSDTGISAARAKTDRLDAQRLAKLLWAGELEAVWRPDERTRAMRRRLARRSQLVRARTRAKNEIHAVLMRCLRGKPPVADLFGVKGRAWLAEQELPLAEQETVDAALRQVEFLDAEIEAVERLIATDALSWPEVKRLMTVPGVNVIVAATFIAAVGDIRRFPNPRQLTGYLGLDPKVRQSGSSPGTRGRISKQGSASARHALVEASWSTVRQPGPIAGFYARVKARRGHSIAIVAAARKLACLFGSRRKARVRQTGAHQVGPRRTKSRGRPKALDLHLDTSSPAPAGTVSREVVVDQADLTFIRRPKRKRTRCGDQFHDRRPAVVVAGPSFRARQVRRRDPRNAFRDMNGGLASLRSRALVPPAKEKQSTGFVGCLARLGEQRSG